MNKIIILSLFIFYHFFPGFFLLTLTQTNRFLSNFFFKIALIIPLSISAITLYATLLTVLRLPFNPFSVFILILLLLIANLIRYIPRLLKSAISNVMVSLTNHDNLANSKVTLRQAQGDIKFDKLKLFECKRNFLKEIKEFLKAEKNDYQILAILIMLGVLTSGIVYLGFKNEYVPMGRDPITHQEIVSNIAKEKNVKISTISPLKTYYKEDTFYPYALHVIPALLKMSEKNDYKTIYNETLFLTAATPLSVYCFSYFLTKNKKISLFSALIAVSFSFFPYWAYEWGGYANIASIIFLSPIFIHFILAVTEKKISLTNIALSSLLLAGLYYLHFVEALLSIPLFSLIYLAVNKIKPNLIMVKKIILFALFFILLISYTILPVAATLKPAPSKGENNITLANPFYDKYLKLNDQKKIIEILPIKSFIDAPRLLFLDNSNYFLLIGFLIGIFYLIIKKKKEPAEIFIIIMSFIFLAITAHSSATKVFANQYIFSTWAHWYRISYHFIYFIPLIVSIFTLKLTAAFEMPFLLSSALVIIFLIKPIKFSYYKLKVSAGEFVSLKKNEMPAYNWIKKNVDQARVFLNPYYTGNSSSTWWLTAITGNKMIFPRGYDSPFDFRDREKEFEKVILNPGNHAEFLKVMKKYQADYIITSKDDILNYLPFVFYINQSNCVKLIYSSSDKTNLPAQADCTAVWNKKDNFLINMLDPNLTYVYQNLNSCSNNQPKICLDDNKFKIGLESMNDQVISGIKYQDENNILFRNYARILIPYLSVKDVRHPAKTLTLHLHRPSNEIVTITVANENFKAITVLKLDKDGWNNYDIDLTKMPPDSKYIILYTDYQYQPEGELPNYSFAVNYLVFE